MSEQDGLAAGAVSLEGDPATVMGPPPGGAPAAPAAGAPAEPVAAPQGDEDAEPEGVVSDGRGQRLVPLEVLKRERQALKDELRAVKAAEDALKADAERGKAIQGQLDQLRPLFQRLQQRQDIVQALMSDKPLSAGPAAPAPDPGEAILPKPEAEDLARTLELYTPEGQPDVTRARKIAVIMRKGAEEEATRKLAPVAQTMATSQAAALKAQYSQVKDKAGRTVNPQVLEQLWSVVPPELVARDPSVANVLYYAARGYAAHHGLDEPAAPARAPIVSESPGGGRPQAPSLTEFDQRIRKVMQVSEKAYQDVGAKFKPGAINVLED